MLVVPECQSSAFSAGDACLSESDQKATIEVYKLCIEMADRVSQRRQTANAFYLSINTALISGSLYVAGHSQTTFATVILSLIGFAIAVIWSRNIASYRTLNASKFSVIHAIEKRIPVRPFTLEWELLTEESRKGAYKHFNEVEKLVPYVYSLLHMLQLARLAF